MQFKEQYLRQELPVPPQLEVLAVDYDAALQQLRPAEEMEAAKEGDLSHPEQHLPGQEEHGSMPAENIPKEAHGMT